MQSAPLPLDVLADELGAAAGRIEREIKLQFEARAAQVEQRLIALELAAFQSEQKREDRLQKVIDLFVEKANGQLLEVKPVLDELNCFQQRSEGRLEALEKVLVEKVEERAQRLEVFLGDHAGLLHKELAEKVDAKLAAVKDGKDGLPGKDADITHFELKFKTLEDYWESRICERLDSVRNGVDGEPGKPGEPGPPGEDGKDGKLPIAREWTNRIHYEGDVVRHPSGTFQALSDTASEPPHSDWGALALSGAEGRGFRLRGTYDAAAEYRQHDIVMINRNSFAAKCDNPGECPGDGWQLFAPSGGRGKEGPPGGKGIDGRSVSIAKLEADPDAMVLRITDSLGKTFELDLEPIAERIVEAAR